ncbi:hypothetical protein OG381_00885 [Streptomyces sp. NBC_00490]|uniref:hypothetical protein n=1 Tax=Streptomyces sp. NBC_00490 TaxID=2903657 RepID=UPI002E178A55
MTSAAAATSAIDPVLGPVRSAREAVPPQLWEKQVQLLVRDYPHDTVMAARVLDQGYAYLLTAMTHRGESLGLAPSKLVDIGVHTIILDTVAYAELRTACMTTPRLGLTNPAGPRSRPRSIRRCCGTNSSRQPSGSPSI